MKTRESGMPDEAMWTSFFSPEQTLGALWLREDSGNVVDFGCGYGTFAIAAAKITRAPVHGIDIESCRVCRYSCGPLRTVRKERANRQVTRVKKNAPPGRKARR
jgi:predicted RNA methylase